MTLACLASVYEQTRTPFEVIVVDNASTDGTVAALREAFPADAYPNLTLLAETENRGFGPTHPLALAHATTDHYLLLNPDTVVLDHALDELWAFSQRVPTAGIWGGRTLYADGTLNPTSVFRRMTPFSVLCRVVGLNNILHRSSLFNSEYFGNWDRGDERPVDIVTGCLLLITRDLWERLNGFDDAFIMYGEEVDLCLRAIAAGAAPRMTPKATIVHYGGASQTLRSDKMVRLMRAKIELIRRHFHPATRRISAWMFGLWPLSRSLVWHLIALTGRPNSKEKAAVWSEVWQRRAEWKIGYAAQAPTSGAGAAP